MRAKPALLNLNIKSIQKMPFFKDRIHSQYHLKSMSDFCCDLSFCFCIADKVTVASFNFQCKLTFQENAKKIKVFLQANQ
tara:strand:- start:1229 stop:1468 length:240 start_codon:yes stop_codon:yes gene_type:complete